MSNPTPAPRREETRVFLSYSRRDMAFVDRLEQALVARGFTVYIDRTGIEKGVDWWERICQLIGQADTMVFVISPDAVASAVCNREAVYAAGLGKRLLPVVWREVDNAQVPAELARLNYVFFSGRDATGAGIDFESALDQLTGALETDIDWVREHTRLGELARHWQADGRPPEQHLRGRQLEAAIDWLHDTLRRTGRKAPDETDPAHAFIRDSARAWYRPGLFGWRYRLLLYPAIVAGGVLLALAAAVADGALGLGLAQQLGITGLEHYIGFALLVVLALYLAYVAGAARRRYLIARRVAFRPVWPARLYAAGSVLYNLLWLGAAVFALALYLQ